MKYYAETLETTRRGYGWGIYLTDNKESIIEKGLTPIEVLVQDLKTVEPGSEEYNEKVYPKLPGSDGGMPFMNDMNLAAVAAGFNSYKIELMDCRLLVIYDRNCIVKN